MKRRCFVLGTSGALLVALSALAQTRSAPVVGFLRNTSAEDSKFLIDALRTGLREAGYIEKKNLEFEYRFADGKHERMASLAAALIERPVDVLVAGGAAAAHAAKAATSKIPIVFTIGEDPTRIGMVENFNRPGGNVTGVVFLTLNGKRLELFHGLVPHIKTIAHLVDPNDRQTSSLQSEDAQATARALGIKLIAYPASKESEIEDAFAGIAQRRIRAVHVGGGALFLSKRRQILSLAAHQSIPVSFHAREGAEAGALMSYGASIPDAYRQAGLYVGRILKGTKAGDLPVLQSSTPQLVINLKTAKTLGITVPQSLLQRTDEVIQ